MVKEQSITRSTKEQIDKTFSNLMKDVTKVKTFKTAFNSDEVVSTRICWMPSRRACKGNYRQCRLKYKSGKWGHTLCHHLAIAATKFDTIEEVRSAFKDKEVSHRCNNAWCCNPEHLRLESHNDNMSRQRCPVWFKCMDCGQVHRACSHDPPCI